ncbi:MAG: hypothetical protein J2P54_22465, partial [Bradyrhizobiaceae bacterium]|nr:hypothetical protein [Bradyrhizobiaceae bacterium]
PGPFVAWMTLEKATDTSVYLPPPIEIAVGASPVFQIASQPAEEHQTTVVWDLSQFWLVGDNQFPGQHETILLAAFPLAV